jgi:hypothetical protein
MLHSVAEITTAIYVILYSIVTDMVPYFSVLELKFIEIFSHNAANKKKKRLTSSLDSFRDGS